MTGRALKNSLMGLCFHLQSSQTGCTSPGTETELRIFGKTTDICNLIYSSFSVNCLYYSDFIYLV